MKYISAWAPVIILMTIIFYLSSRQRIAVSEAYVVNFLFFKTLHVIEYAMLAFFILRAVFIVNKHRSFFQIAAISAVIAILYAASDELHQQYVPTREGTVRDVLIDTVGIGLAIGYTKYYFAQFKRWI